MERHTGRPPAAHEQKFRLHESKNGNEAIGKPIVSARENHLTSTVASKEGKCYDS